jgi:hypothetical protein
VENVQGSCQRADPWGVCSTKSPKVCWIAPSTPSASIQQVGIAHADVWRSPTS